MWLLTLPNTRARGRIEWEGRGCNPPNTRARGRMVAWEGCGRELHDLITCLAQVELNFTLVIFTFLTYMGVQCSAGYFVSYYHYYTFFSLLFYGCYV